MSAEDRKLPHGAEYRNVEDVKGVEIDRTPTGSIVITLDPRYVFGVTVGLEDEGKQGHFLITPGGVDRKAAALALCRGLTREADSL